MLFNLLGNSAPGSSITGAYNFGAAFGSVIAGNVNGIRFYKISTDTGTHVGSLWDNSGTLLAQVTFTGETASGWQYMAFASPYAISPNTQYVVSCSHPASKCGQTAGAAVAAISSSAFAYPLYTPTYYDRYVAGTPVAFPSNADGDNRFTDLEFEATWILPPGIRDVTGEQCVVGALQGVCIGGLTSIHGDTFDRHLQVGVREELVDGYPSPPCLALDIPGFWRFKWQIIPGSQTISCYAKQVSNLAGYRPTLVIKKNPLFGVGSDTIGVAPSGTGWVKIGPLTVVATQPGVLYCELHNNDTQTFQSTAYFDNMDK